MTANNEKTPQRIFGFAPRPQQGRQMPETAYAIWLIFDERDRVNLVTRGHAGVAKASRALRTSKT
ncbi:MAG TPA: hypothetical protein VMV33_11045, partial [Rhodocyclaceae bacterium]|nr:hypothetical protein [Rhodocyclaceae bacterium]